MPSATPLDWVCLQLLPGGPRRKLEALERLGHPADVAFRADPALLTSRPADRHSIVRARRGLVSRAQDELRRCERLGLSLFAAEHPEYPAALATLADRPLLLYVRGRVAPARVRIALVGSRRCTVYGRRVAAGLATSLAARGVEVVSGGARGIDTCAHRGALEGGGSTVAVLGCGFAHVYPPENEELFERIAANGAVVSELPLDARPLPGHFPQRNRLISGLSAAVVVVEAAARSGSLITASHALEQGREVLAVPGPVSSERSRGCHALIQQGARLVQNTDDILDELPPMYRSALLPAAAPGAGDTVASAPALSADEAAILSLLDDTDPVHVEELAEKVPFGVGRLQSALFGLVVRGSVEELTGRYYLCRPRREP